MLKPDLFKRFKILNQNPKLLTEEEKQEWIVIARAFLLPVDLPCPRCGHQHSQVDAHEQWTMEVSDDEYKCPNTNEKIVFNIMLTGPTFWSVPKLDLAKAATE